MVRYLNRLEIGRTNSTIIPTVMNPQPPWINSRVPSVPPTRTRRNPKSKATAGNADVKAARVDPNQQSLWN